MNLRHFVRLARCRLKDTDNRFLRKCSGVIHVGANSGQEAYLYGCYGLPVVWIEAIPDVFDELQRHIAPFRKQRAVNALITDRDGEQHVLHISSNDGHSSSIFQFGQHSDIWPEVHYVRDITLTSQTLPSALHGIDTSRFDVLVLDVQGAEMLVLRGAKAMLKQFRYIKAEAADFEVYSGCATATQIVSFLGERRFYVIRKDVFATHPSGGQCFDMLFKRSMLRSPPAG